MEENNNQTYDNNMNNNFNNASYNQNYNNGNFNQNGNPNYNQNYNQNGNPNFNQNYNNGFNNGYRRLIKSKTNRVLAGVCGGIGEYFNIDPTLVRIGAVILGCCGAGIIAYIIAAICMPEGV